ncbi:MAG: tetratricopeptide repeat protein [Lamprobacter sp.]|uniref:tetratricopeptide repeat protein n=1 Tax=Lamprobacter sp. TaxID=3100796 RepID=UPI002B25DA4D|nr:tetratricopeptide repeat protein [Lamprobacter sp.]MEA3641689.1 tetratricopeptide repeat protein [Lamprobacter sp.]
MRTQTRLLSVLTSLLALVALASSADQAVEPPLQPLASGSDAASTSAQAAPANGQEPLQELSSDLVYATLVAEVALQRGDYDAAVEHFLAAAKLAREPRLAERAVRSALNIKRPEAAREALALWTELEPDAPKAHQLSAFLALEAGDRATALESLKRVIELGGVPGQGYLQAAQVLGRLPDPNDRLALMRELVAALNADTDPDAQFALATLAAAAGDHEVAVQLAERASVLRPGWTDPQVFLVRLLVRAEQPEQAHAALDRYISQAPDDAELKLMKAQLHMDAEESEQALAVFNELLVQTPDRPDVLFAAAVLALDIRDMEAARGYLERLKGLGERPDEVAFLLGQVEEQAGNHQDALALYEEVQGQNRTNAQVRIARLHAKNGDVRRARELLQQLRDQYAGQTSAFYLIEAEMLRDQGLEQQALEVYDLALGNDPDNADLLYARAMLAVGMGKVALLERDLRRILVADPDHVDALNALGYTLADRTDRFDAAKSLIERALQLRPDDPAILDSMGWVLYRKGQPEAAEVFLRRALEQGFDAEIAAHLGEVLWTLGRQDEARAVWRNALDEAPEHEYLLRVLSRFRFSQSDN